MYFCSNPDYGMAGMSSLENRENIRYLCDSLLPVVK